MEKTFTGEEKLMNMANSSHKMHLKAKFLINKHLQEI